MQGQTINGYTLKYRLGEGGMAEVWYAENEIGKPAAVKILKEELTNNEAVVERFHNEALVMVKLNHPNIRQVFGYGYLGKRHCIVMEYLEGKDLEALMKDGKRFSDEELRNWWNQAAKALEYTHALGVVHRDIKPSNLFLCNDGTIKLLDFGIAKIMENASMTKTGIMMGTLMYMSPEQVNDFKRVDYRTDLYSLAVTFVHLSTGKAPYNDTQNSYLEIPLSIVTKPLDMDKVPETWREFLTPYLEKKPEDRPALRPFEEVHSSHRETASVAGAKTMVNEVPSSQKKDITPTQDDPSNKKVSPSDEKEEPLSNKQGETSVPKSKSKKGLWIGLGIVAVVLSVVLVSHFRKKADEKAFAVCENVQDYRNYVNRYGKSCRHFDEARMIIAEHERDSMAKAEIEAKRLAMKDVPLFSFNVGIRKDGDFNYYWGWINSEGDVVIEPTFGPARDYCEEMAAVLVREEDKWGYIDKLGGFVINPQFEKANDFSEGLAVVMINGRYGVIDKQGTIKIDPQFAETKPQFSENMLGVKIDGKWGFVDTQGNIVIEPQFSDVRDCFSEGLMGVKKDGKWGFVDKTGKMVVDCKYDNVYSFSEGLAAVCVGDNLFRKWGFVDKTGTEVISPQFQDANSFSGGCASVKPFSSNYSYIIDKNGKTLFNVYGSVWSFKEGLAYVSTENDNNRFIDHNGNTVIMLGYRYLNQSFHNGLAVVCNSNGTWSFIDKTGTSVFTYSAQNYFKGGFSSFTNKYGIYVEGQENL